MAENMAITYHKVFGLDVVAVRPGYVYGPGNSAGGYYLDRARTELGYTPRFTLEEGMEDWLRWLRSESSHTPRPS